MSMQAQAQRAPLRPAPPPPSSAGRAPPSDLAAEAAVLSAVLLERSALDRVLEILAPQHFYADCNGRIFEAALSLAATGQPVDIVTIASWLRDRERLAQVGGSAYLATLADATPAVEHIEAHATIVKAKWRLRQLIATCQRAAAEGYGDVGEAQEWIDGVEAEVHDIARASEVRSTVCARDAIAPVFQSLVDAAARGSNTTGLATGHTRIDSMTGGMESGQFWIVAGRPGMGKTAYANWLAVNVAHTGFGTERIGVGIFTLEMSREEVLKRMIFAEARCNLRRLREGRLEAADWTRLTEASQFVSALPLYIDDTPGLTPLALRSKVRRLRSECARSGVRLGLVVADHIGLMRVDRPVNSREQEVSEASRSLKELAKECSLTVLGLSQLNRQVEMRGVKDKRPGLADLRDSGSLEQDADNVLFVYRDDYYDHAKNPGVAEILLAKQRSGETGRAYARWVDYCTRFDNLAPEEYPRGEGEGDE